MYACCFSSFIGSYFGFLSLLSFVLFDVESESEDVLVVGVVASEEE